MTMTTMTTMSSIPMFISKVTLALLAFVALAAAVHTRPKNAILREHAKERCDWGTGMHAMHIWPAGGDRLNAVNISLTKTTAAVDAAAANADADVDADAGEQYIHWEFPVSSVYWLCDGMDEKSVQITTLNEASAWWSVAVTVEKKMHPSPSGRRTLTLTLSSYDVVSTAVPRSLVVKDRHFVDPLTNDTVLLEGTNVVMKAHP